MRRILERGRRRAEQWRRRGVLGCDRGAPPRDGDPADPGGWPIGGIGRQSWKSV